jgi:hypothetical protein
LGFKLLKESPFCQKKKMGANLGKTTKFCSKHTFWGKVAENQDFIKEKSK